MKLNLNFRIWGTENPHTYIENPTHSKRGTVRRLNTGGKWACDRLTEDADFWQKKNHLFG